MSSSPTHPDGRDGHGERERWIATARVRRAVGLGGQVEVDADPDVGDAFAVGARYQLGAPDGTAPAGGSLTVTDSVRRGSRRALQFAQITDRAAAEGIRGHLLWRRADAGDLDANAYWVDEVVGQPVMLADGSRAGTVSGVRPGTAHDYLVVRTDQGEALVPAVAQLVELHEDRVIAADLPGLLDPQRTEPASRS